VRSLAVWLALSVLCASPHALAGALTPTYVRTSLDSDGATPLGGSSPRRIRDTLDEQPSAPPNVSPSHAVFPLDSAGRLIRVSLDEGATTKYGHLSPARPQTRRVRLTLD
jgi:hypothetical protein